MNCMNYMGLPCNMEFFCVMDTFRDIIIKILRLSLSGSSPILGWLNFWKTINNDCLPIFRNRCTILI